jgi:hypothetical protein
VQVLVRESRVTGNAVDGVTVVSGAGNTVLVTISGTSLVGSQRGLRILGGGPATAVLDRVVVSENPNSGVRNEEAGSRVLVSRSRIVRNGVGLANAAGSTILSYGNNVVDENTTNLTGVTSAPLQ